MPVYAYYCIYIYIYILVEIKICYQLPDSSSAHTSTRITCIIWRLEVFVAMTHENRHASY